MKESEKIPLHQFITIPAETKIPNPRRFCAGMRAEMRELLNSRLFAANYRTVKGNNSVKTFAIFAGIGGISFLFVVTFCRNFFSFGIVFGWGC